jgi:hypothetical protein
VGTLFQFLWHFCSITARVLALSLFASVFPKWIGKAKKLYFTFKITENKNYVL